MSAFAFWIAVTLVEAAILHLLAVWYLPRLLGRVSAGKIKASTGTWNRMEYRGLPSAGGRGVTSNPDMAAAYGTYDVSGGPVRIHCVVPAGDRYWSIALYAGNMDCICVINDRTATGAEFDLVVGGGARAGEVLVKSPSARGVIVVRMVVENPGDPEELARVEATVRKTVVTVP